MIAVLERLEVWLLGPPGLTVGELILLGSGAGVEREQRLHELMDWQNQRRLAVVKGVAGVAGSFITALFLSLFRDELRIDQAVLIVALAGAAMALGFSAYLLRRLAEQQRVYVTAVAILRAL